MRKIRTEAEIGATIRSAHSNAFDQLITRNLVPPNYLLHSKGQVALRTISGIYLVEDRGLAGDVKALRAVEDISINHCVMLCS